MEMGKICSYLLLTLGPGTVVGDSAWMIVVEWPSWRVVEKFQRKHTVYETTHKGFAGASLFQNQLIVSTEAEILTCTLAPIVVQDVFSDSYLNDVHHVAATEDKVVVVNTGLDCLEIYNRSWQLQNTLSLIPSYRFNPAYLWKLFLSIIKKSQTRRSGQQLYQHLDTRAVFPNFRKWLSPLGLRQISKDLRHFDSRPHFLHPNHVTIHNSEYWVTLLMPGQILRVPDGKVLARGLGRPHDGICVDEEFFVTDCLNSRFLKFDIRNEIPYERKLETKISPSHGGGFLRGLAIIKDNVFLGLSALRGAKSYSKGRVLRVGRSSGDLLEEWSIPGEFGNNIFSIVDVSEYYG